MTLKKVFSGITSVGFSGNLLDTTTNYAVFNAPAGWQGMNRLWVKLPKGIWNVTIEYEGDSSFVVDGLLSTPTTKVDKLVYSNGDKALAVRIQEPSSSADNVIVGMTKYQDPLSLSLVNAIAYCARRWHHGAKQNRPRHRNRQRYGLVITQDRQRSGATHRGTRNPRIFSRKVRTHVADVRAGVSSIHHQLLHTPSRHQQQGVSHPAGLFRQRLGNHHLHRLATVGGGA